MSIKLTFRALALRHSSFVIRSDETSALYSLWWPIYILNLVDITQEPSYGFRLA